MMNLRHLAASAALLLAFVSNSQAQWFARANAAHFDPSWKGYSGATGVGIAGGRFFGARQEHEVSLDISSAKWHADEVDFGVQLEGDETHTPFLLNYRYHVEGTEEFRRIGFYIGPCVGYTRSHVDFDLRGVSSQGSTQLKDTAWEFSWGGNVGFIVRLEHNLELDFGYRYLKISDTSYDFREGSIDVEAAHFNIFYGGVSVRF